jgi:hemolysin activation/secretion protein
MNRIPPSQPGSDRAGPTRLTPAAQVVSADPTHRTQAAAARRAAWAMCAALLAAASSPSTWAAAPPPPPDAGQTLQQLQAPPPPTAPNTPAPTLNNQAEHPDVLGGDQTTRVHLSRLVFSGNTIFDSGTLTRVAKLSNAEVTLADLRAAARRVSQYYRGHGYVLARAYLPAQDVTGGVVTLAILEGKLGSTTINNTSGVSTRQIKSILADQIQADEPLNSTPANRALILLQNTPGVGGVQGTLSPGTSVGTTALEVDVTRAPLISGSVAIDDNGNSYTGQDRLTAAFNLANLTGHGDQLDIQGTLSEHNSLNYAHVSWDAPVSHDGLRLGVAAGNVDYSLGGSFKDLDAHGNAQTAALYGSYPLWLAPTSHVNLYLSIEHRTFTDDAGAVDLNSHKSADAAVFTLSGDFTDSWLGTRAITAWRVSNTYGNLSLHTPEVAALDAASAQTAGSYDKVLVGLTREQTLLDKLSLYVAATGQESSKNLDTSEQFFLGGPYGIRAYPQGEAPGDGGWLATVELRYHLMRPLQAFAFYDSGQIQTNHHPYLEQPNDRHLSGPGLGANGVYGPFSLKATLAWRCGSEAPTSDKDRKPRVWVQAAYAF